MRHFLSILLLGSMIGCGASPYKSATTTTGNQTSTKPTITATATPTAVPTAAGCTINSMALLQPLNMSFTAETCSASDVRLREYVSGGLADFRGTFNNQSIMPYVLATTATGEGRTLPLDVYVISAGNHHLMQMQYDVHSPGAAPSWIGPGDIGATMTSMSYAAVVLGGWREGTYWNGSYSQRVYVGASVLDGTYIEGTDYAGNPMTVQYIQSQGAWATVPGYKW